MRELVVWLAILGLMWIVAPPISEALYHGNPPAYSTAAPW